jgi:hypothetical protein
MDLSFKMTPLLDVGQFNIMLNTLKQSLGRFGSDIKLIDEKAYQAGLKKFETDTKSSFNNVAKDSEKSGTQLGDGIATGIKKGFDSGIKSADTFKGALDGISQKFATFGLAVQGIQQVTSAFNSFIAPYQEFDQQLRNIGTLGVKNFEDFRNEAINLATTVPDTVAGVTEAVYNAISAGAIRVVDGQADIASGMTFIEQASKLAVAGLSTTNDAVKGLAAVTNAYGTNVLSASRAADILFGTVKSGVTTIPELNNSLAQFVPISAAAGIGLEEVTGALATLTKQGVPTAQAATQIRAAISELMAPGAQLASVMKEAGVSMESLQEEGLQVSMNKIGDTMARLGTDAANTFGSIESVQFALATTGDNAGKFASDIEAISASVGSVDEAFNIAGQGIGVRIQSILNGVQAAFFKTFNFLGDGFVVLSGAANQLLPLAMTFAQLTTLAEPMQKLGLAARGYGITIMNTLVPGLITQNATTGALVFNTNALTFANIKQAAIAKASVIATTAMTAAQWLLNIALNANPIGIVVLAVGALIGGLILLYRNVEPVRKVFDGLGSVLGSVFDGLATIGKGVFSIFISVGQALYQMLIMPLQVAWGVLTAFADVLFGSAEAGINFELIMQNIGKAVTWITDRLEIVQIGIKAFSAVIKSVVDSIVKTITSILTLDFSGFIDNIRNSGKNAGEAFGNAFEDEVENRKFDKVKDELVSALDSAAKEGTLTEELVQGLADKYGVSVERVKELAQTNKEIQETIQQTNALKDGSIGFSVKLNLIQDKFNEAVEKEKSLRLELDALRRTGGAEQIAAKEQELITQRGSNLELNKELTSLKKLEEEVMAQYKEKTAQKKSQTKEAKSQYEIAVADFELTKKAAEFNQQLNEVEYALAQRRSGIIASDRDIEIEKLARSKQQTREARSQFSEAQNLFDIAKKQFDIETTRGKVSTNTQKEMQDAQNRLNDYILELRNAELSELELEVLLNANDEALLREVNRIKTEISLAEIEYNIKLGLASDKDLLIAEMDIIENRMAELMTNLADASLTADIVNEMKLEYTNLQSELFDKQNELREKNRLAQINEITNLAVRERELRIFEAEKVYAEELKLAGTNSALRLKAHIALQTAKLKADQEYLAESSRVSTVAAQALAEFNMALLAGGTSSDLSKQNAERRARLREEEDELISSFGRRETSREDFLKRSAKIEEEYISLASGTSSVILSAISDSFSQALASASGILLEQSRNMLSQAIDQRESYNRSIEALNRQLLDIEDKTSAEYQQILHLRNNALEQSKNASNEIYRLMAFEGAAQLGLAIAQNKAIFKTIIQQTFDFLQRMAALWSAQIVAGSLATPQSILTGGIAGIAQFSGMLLLLTAAIQGAKAAALSGFRKGGYTGDIAEDKVAGIVHGREYVVNARGTSNKENQMFFDWTNRTGGSVIDYVHKQYDVSELIKGYRFEKEQIKLLIENDIIQMPQNDNRELIKKIDILTNEVKELREIKRLIEEGNYSRSSRQAVDVDVRFSESAIVEKVNLNKYANLKRM